MTRDSILRAVRTFIITTLTLFIPGLLGWLHEMTEWAKAAGERPFPDGHDLSFLGVAAIVAGFVAVVNLIWNGIEDGLGKGMLRNPPVPVRPPRTESGQIERLLIIGILAVVFFGLLFFFFD